MKPTDDVITLKGVGAKKAEALSRLGIQTIEDLFYHYPRAYQDKRSSAKIAEAPVDEYVLIRAQLIMIIPSYNRSSGRRTLRLLIQDDSGSLEVIFFNSGYIQKTLKQGKVYEFYGKISEKYGKRSLLHPEVSLYDEGEEHKILPVYPLTRGLTQRDLRKWELAAQELLESEEFKDFLPESVISENRLCSYGYAMKNVHFPQDEQRIKIARFRLIFDELFMMQLAMSALKRGIKDSRYIVFDKRVSVKPYIDSLPFELTGAQKRAAEDVISDMESKKSMNRLIQGDVGSGKTAVAEIALYKAAKCGYQAALMAPTEILAKQHYKDISRDLGKHGIECGLIVSSMKAAEKKSLLKRLAAGEIAVLIGTHALIQKGVDFKNLGLVITDEQHRFGVRQRSELSEKGESPDVLVMTATPIPRTLAVVVYGELDISIIDELPAGRKKTETRALSQKERREAYKLAAAEIAKGHQCYVVAPLIDESEEIEARSASEIYEELKKKFPEYTIALLHGELSQSEKDAIMSEFQEGRIDMLVSTVVIEVGINVPNATIMVIENAERFGLAQLHQLRGRVGRGADKAYCVLISDGESEIAKQRADIMVKSADGFEIAEKDLLLRGPGEFFGTRQHGIPSLKIANLIKHRRVLAKAQEAAKKLLAEDPRLAEPENSGLRERIMHDYELVL